MADEIAEPGAPTPQAADKASDDTAPKAVAAPNSALSAVKQLDRIILRLNKLVSTPAGLSAFLSTSNYILYILAYLHPKLPSLPDLTRRLLSARSTLIKPQTALIITITDAPALPPAAALAALLSKCRTTLRLLGCLPLYAWLRTLLAGPKPGADKILHRIAALQASSYFTYQALENISFLADCSAIPARFVARINKGDPSTARLYLWAYRFWLAGVSCDFLRLAREAQLEGRRRAARAQMREDGRAVAVYQEEEDRKVDRKWWMDFVIASAWMPMALHYSSSGGGLPG